MLRKTWVLYKDSRGACIIEPNTTPSHTTAANKKRMSKESVLQGSPELIGLILAGGAWLGVVLGWGLGFGPQQMMVWS